MKSEFHIFGIHEVTSGHPLQVTASHTLQERKRLRQNHPDMNKLNDEQQLKDLLKQAREKLGPPKDPFPFNPDAFTAKKSD